jgi:tRNA modification GTPase
LNIEHDFRRQSLSLLEDVQTIKSGYSHQQQVRQGVRVAILGVVNAGKSTLFNTLVRKDRAIVTAIAGTTRDSIELSVYREGNFITFIDTAGLRTTNDEIERQGIERSMCEAQASDIILLVFDASIFLSQEIQKVYQDLIHQFRDKILIVFNKIDQQDALFLKKFAEVFGGNFIKVSAKNITGIDDLELKVNKKVQELFSQLKSPYLLNQRQYRLLEEIERKLDFIVKNSVDVLHYELIAYHLKEILEKIAELTGRNITERMLDTVFNDFCVGK